MRLTSEQEKIVECDSRIVLASACPGSGKSTTLAARALRLALQDEEPILVCTFSKKSARDIEEKLGGINSHLIYVATIHKLGFDIVKSNWSLLRKFWGSDDWPDQPELANKQTELDLIDKWIKAKNIKGYIASIFYDDIQSIRNLNTSPSVIRSLIKGGAYLGRFSDKTITLWESYENYRLSHGIVLFSDMISLACGLMTHPEVSSKIRTKFRHILLDEAQDTSSDQWNLLRSLISEAKTSLIVYDVNQAIYGWRDGDTNPLYTLGFIHDAVRYSLTTSFRSKNLIAEIANKIVRDPSSLIFTYKKGGKVAVSGFSTAQEESQYIVSCAQPNDAIIARTNSYLELIERDLIMAGKAYQGFSFYRSHHICELVDAFSSGRINYKNLDEYLYNTLSDREVDDIKRAAALIKDIGLPNFSSLTKRARNLYGTGITLTTGHSSKGLEWQNVWVVGASNGVIPHALSKDKDEERNLFYVMVTRAKDQLNITWVNKPSVFIPKEWVQ